MKLNVGNSPAQSAPPGRGHARKCVRRAALNVAQLQPRDALGRQQPRSGTVVTALPAGARGAEEASTSGSSSSTPASNRNFRFRLDIDRPLSAVNWDRYELILYQRVQAAEDAKGGGAGEDEDAGQDEGATGDGFAQRLRESDLTAAYFRGWDDPTRHLPMLQDRLLQGAWREALSPGSLEGQVVLDVGCGVGLLSLMAAKAGAAHVYAVDGSAGAVDAAQRIVRANGLEDRITVVHGAIEDVELPGVAHGSVDVVLSQWMGPGLLAGGMAHSVAHAARKWLKPGGVVLPDRVSLWAAGLEDRDALQEAKETWSRVGGFDLSSALAQVIRHPRRDVLTRKSQLLTAPQLLAEWECAQLGSQGHPVVDPESGAYAECPLRLTAVRDERLFGLVLWWEAQWNMGGKLIGEGKAPVRFTTHPLSTATHYEQLMLDLPKSIRVSADDQVEGQVVLRPGATDPRDLQVDVRLQLLPAAEGAEGQQPGPVVEGSFTVAHH